MPKNNFLPTKDTAGEKEEIDRGALLFDWHFPEYAQYQRSRSWYVIIVILLLALFCIALSTANFIFALFLVLFGIILIIQLRQSPLEVKFAIFEDGIGIGEKFYEWSEIKNFHIIYRPPQIKRLYFDLKNTFFSDFSVPLEKQNPLEIRATLKKYLSEDLSKDSESLTDSLGRLLKI